MQGYESAQESLGLKIYADTMESCMIRSDISLHYIMNMMVKNIFRNKPRINNVPVPFQACPQMIVYS